MSDWWPAILSRFASTVMYPEEVPNAGDQHGNRGRSGWIAVVRDPRHGRFGALRQRHADLVSDARPVVYQRRQCGLTDLVDDSERQGPDGSDLASSRKQTAFTEIVAGRQPAEFDLTPLSVTRYDDDACADDHQGV